MNPFPTAKSEYCFANSLILNQEEGLALIEMTNHSNWKLLYQATRDGFHPRAFHTICDGKENTISVIRNHLNYVFGGYASSQWKSTGNYIADSKAFIFSLRPNGKSNAEKFTINSDKYAIFGGSNYGPTFGKDITIRGESNINFGSHSDFGWSYNLPIGYNSEQENTKQFLCGSYNNWLVTEIEVYVYQGEVS